MPSGASIVIVPIAWLLEDDRTEGALNGGVLCCLRSRVHPGAERDLVLSIEGGVPRPLQVTGLSHRE